MKIAKFGVEIKMEDDMDAAIAVDWLHKLENPPIGMAIHFIALDTIKTVVLPVAKACGTK